MQQDFHHGTEQHLGKKIADHLKMCQSRNVFPWKKGVQHIVNAKFKAVLQLRSSILRPVNTQHVIEYAIKMIFIYK